MPISGDIFKFLANRSGDITGSTKLKGISGNTICMGK
jgi:hypothetical protein